MATTTQTNGATPRTRNTGTAGVVLDFLMKRQGITLSATTIATDTGLERSQVISAVNNLRGSHDIPSPTKGYYVYKGLKAPDPGESPSIRTGDTGRVVIVTDDGRLLMQVGARLFACDEVAF